MFNCLYDKELLSCDEMTLTGSGIQLKEEKWYFAVFTNKLRVQSKAEKVIFPIRLQFLTTVRGGKMRIAVKGSSQGAEKQ